MRTIKRILESLLDADFDIDVDDIGSLYDMNYQCEKFKGNKTFWRDVYNDNICRDPILRANSGFRRVKFAQQNTVDFDEIVDANTFKYYQNNILFSAEWANGAKVSMKFVPQ